MAIYTKEQYRALYAESAKIKSKLEELLRSGEYNNVFALLEEEKSEFLAGYDRVMYVMRLMAIIYKEEVENGIENYVLKNRTVQQIDVLYRTLVFYLRRLEFDLEDEEQMELLWYIREQGVSAVGVLGVINLAPYIYNKEKVWNRFLELINMV